MWWSVPIPSISPDEILLQTSYASICGSDLRMIANGYTGVDQEHPLTLGHEVSGIIHTVGENVKGYKPGQHVANCTQLRMRRMRPMRAGGIPTCGADYQAFGINMDGGFAEFMRVDARTIAQGNIMVSAGSVFRWDEASVSGTFFLRAETVRSALHVHLNDTVPDHRRGGLSA